MRAAIVGVGSVLMGDDAAGPYLVRLLEARYELPPEVTLLDAGTPGPGFEDLLRGYDALLFVDTVKAEAPPGTVRLYRRQELLDALPNLRLSPHDPGLREALLTLDLAGDGPAEALLVGVVPESVALGTGLTPAVRAALQEVEARVLAELAGLGLYPARREQEGEPDLWWER